MRNVSDKICGENQNTYLFVLNDIFLKVVTFKWWCRNIW